MTKKPKGTFQGILNGATTSTINIKEVEVNLNIDDLLDMIENLNKQLSKKKKECSWIIGTPFGAIKVIDKRGQMITFGNDKAVKWFKKLLNKKQKDELQ